MQHFPGLIKDKSNIVSSNSINVAVNRLLVNNIKIAQPHAQDIYVLVVSSFVYYYVLVLPSASACAE